MKEKNVFIIPVADSPGIYHGRGWWNTLQGIILTAKASHRKPAKCSTQGNRAFLLKCILQWILRHLVVSNGNNLSQFYKINKKEVTFIFNVVTILWHLFDKLL